MKQNKHKNIKTKQSIVEEDKPSTIIAYERNMNKYKANMNETKQTSTYSFCSFFFSSMEYHEQLERLRTLPSLDKHVRSCLFVFIWLFHSFLFFIFNFLFFVVGRKGT